MSGLDFILDLAIVALFAGAAGLLCRRLGLSVIVGYLLAGVLIGPFTPPFLLVKDAARIQMLADLGLVFLVFGIGLTFSVRRMQRLGLPLLLATALTALLVMVGCRFVASLLGLTDQQGLFVAAVLMVSSSAIIAKVLEEVGTNHTRWGQLSLGVTLLEDIVAIVMLTMLASATSLGDEERAGGLLSLLSSFTGFVALFSLSVLVLVPWALARLKARGTMELQMLLVTGFLLALGWVAARLGYSMALTAFILGAIIGSTPQRPDVDRLFEGMRHLFGAVFFVAMGMLFDVGMVGEFWPALLALAGAAFLLRVPAAAAGLLLVGNTLRDSLRAALTLTPLGEFSFVIAFLGVSTGVMPESFYPAAVGASLLTCLASPLLIRRAEPASAALEKCVPRRVAEGLSVYHDWLERLQTRRSRSFAWKFMAPRVAQTVVQVLVIGGCLALAQPLHDLVQDWLGEDLLFRGGTTALFALAVGLVVLPGVVSVGRNISALSMIAAEAWAGPKGSATLRVLIRRAFASAAVTLAVLWLAVVAPSEFLRPELLAALLLVLLALTLLLWRNLVRWHSSIEIRVNEAIAVASTATGTSTAEWKMPDLERDPEWGLQVREMVLPTNSLHAGLRLLDLRLRQETGASIVGIDRQGYAINNPAGSDRLYPDDRLLLLGSEEALGKATAFLAQATERPPWRQQFDELATERVTVPAGSPAAGRTLAQLDLLNTHGVQIGGIRRAGREFAAPSGGEALLEGDRLLVLGDHRNIRRFQESLEPPPAPQEEGAAGG